MIRIFVDGSAIDSYRLRLTGAQARHLGAALRLRRSERLVAVTADGVEHTCKVLSASPKQVDAEILASAPTQQEPRVHIRLCQALLKGDQFERILEYGAEVGVGSFQPLLTERAIARPDRARLEQRQRRWNEIIRGGAELGRRGRLPELLPPSRIAGALDAAAAAGLQPLLLYEGSGLRSLADVPLAPVRGVCLLIGPEGGWSPAEVKRAEQNGAEPVTLGPRIMRPLPAALVALGVVLQRAGELKPRDE